MVPMILSASDFTIGRSSGMAGNVLLQNPNASDLLQCPAAFRGYDYFSAEAGYQRKYELADLDKFYFAAGYGTGNFTAILGGTQFGRSKYYIEQSLRAGLSYRYKYYNLALIGTIKRVEIDSRHGKIDLNAFSLGLAAGWHYQRYHLAISADNLNRPVLDKNAEKEGLMVNIYGEIESGRGFSVMLRTTLEGSEKPIYALGQYFHINGHGLFWGIQSNPVKYGGGLDINYMNMKLTYAVNYHPVLGFTHNVSLGYILNCQKGK
jgi:hypothetical protein